MSEFTLLIKELAKSPQMTYYFQRCWSVYVYGHFTVPWGHGRGCMNGSDTTDAGGSRDNDNMANTFTLILHRKHFLAVVK